MILIIWKLYYFNLRNIVKTLTDFEVVEEQLFENLEKFLRLKLKAVTVIWKNFSIQILTALDTMKFIHLMKK